MCVYLRGYQFRSSLRTTGSQLQCFVRDIQHNNFIKFNVHSRLQGCGLPAQQKLTPIELEARLYHQNLFIAGSKVIGYRRSRS